MKTIVSLASAVTRRITALIESVRRRLRPRTRWNTLRNRHREAGVHGVFQLFQEVFQRIWRNHGAEAESEVAPCVSLEMAKIRLREQAAANFHAFLASGEIIQFYPGDAPWLSVVLVLWGQAELTLQCLQALAEQAREGVEVVIVDNASPDETPTLLNQVSGARILRNKENRGFLLAANQGAMAAMSPLLLFLNNDAVIRADSLRHAKTIMAANPDIGAVGGRILLPDGRLQEAGCVVWGDGSCAGYLRGEAAETPSAMFRRDVDFCSGVFLMTRAALFKEMGGFDSVFAPAYYEEVDYCLRLWARGMRVVYDPWIVVDHYEYGSAGSSDAATERMATNQEHFRSKHAVVLADKEHPAGATMNKARMRGNWNGQLLYIDDYVPRSDLGSGFPRALALLETIRECNWFVTVVSMVESAGIVGGLHGVLSRDFEVIPGLSPEKIEAFLEERQGCYDMLLISRPSNMERLCHLFKERPDLFEDMKVIYDAEAIWAFRDITKASVLGHPLSEKDATLAVQKELDLAKPAACVMAVSEMEKEIFRQTGHPDVRVLTHVAPARPIGTPVAQRSGMLFVGALFTEGSPNVDSVVWFVDKVMPLLRQAGLGAKLIVAGRNDALPRSFASLRDVVLLGSVDDLSPWYGKCKIFVAPTRFSAGIPLKVVEAAGFGLPVVATSLLARQLTWSDGVELLTGDDSQDFAQQCLRLYQEPELWGAIRDAALGRIIREYSQDTFRNAVTTLLDLPVKRQVGDEDYSLGVQGRPPDGNRTLR